MTCFKPNQITQFLTHTHTNCQVSNAQHTHPLPSSSHKHIQTARYQTLNTTPILYPVPHTSTYKLPGIKRSTPHPSFTQFLTHAHTNCQVSNAQHTHPLPVPHTHTYKLPGIERSTHPSFTQFLTHTRTNCQVSSSQHTHPLASSSHTHIQTARYEVLNTPILQLSSSLGNLSVLRAYSGLPGGFQCGLVRKCGRGLQQEPASKWHNKQQTLCTTRSLLTADNYKNSHLSVWRLLMHGTVFQPVSLQLLPWLPSNNNLKHFFSLSRSHNSSLCTVS